MLRAKPFDRNLGAVVCFDCEVVDAVVDYLADGFEELNAGVDQVLAHFGRDVEMRARTSRVRYGARVTCFRCSDDDAREHIPFVRS